MKHPTFDSAGYPTEETLQAIREWDPKDMHGLFRFLKEAWKYPEYFTRGGRHVRVSTVGWSGNEDLIDALQENQAAWSLTWFSSRRGGHYTFRLPKRKP